MTAYFFSTHSAWREMTESQWDAAVRADEPQPPPAPVEPPPDDEVGDEPDIEGVEG